MALKKDRRKGLGVTYRGVATHWKTDVGSVIIIAEHMSAVAIVAQRIEPADFDPALCRDVVVFAESDTEVA